MKFDQKNGDKHFCKVVLESGSFSYSVILILVSYVLWDHVYLGSTPHPGCQWQMKVYRDSLLKM